MLDRMTATLMVLLVGVVVLGVLDRFILGLGLTWTEELARFLLVWLSMVAAIVAMRRSAHFRIEILTAKLGPGYLKGVALICILICLVIAWSGLQLALKFHTQISPALGLPMSAVYAAIPVAFLGMAISLALDMGAPRGADDERIGGTSRTDGS